MNTIIEIFNQLTHNELADCNTFENIIVNHYNKFKWVYNHLKDLDSNNIQKISCIDSKKGLYIKIIPYDIDDLSYFLDIFIEDDFIFDCKIKIDNNVLIIVINDKELSEVEIDESRFGIHKKSNSCK